jgi:ketosteroid isomerase-like protein
MLTVIHDRNLEAPVRTAMTLLAGMFLGGGLILTATQPDAELLADAATRQAVTHLKQSIVDGHRTRDRAGLDRLYAEDYTALDARGGLRTNADLLNALPGDPEMVEGRYELTRVRRWGAIAVASGHGRMVYRNPDGSTRVSEYDSVNVFQERDGRWWYVAAFLP